MELIPEHGPCFICGTQNPHNVGVQWYGREDGTVQSDITLTLAQQGPPGFAHGGVSAALLDEVMGAAVWRAGHNVAVVNLELDYHRPVPLGQPIHIEGRVVEKEGRVVRATGEIRLADGTIAVTGRGIFVEAPHLFDRPFYRNV